jgi:hypothetical protein
MSRSGHMNADLMGAPRLQLAFHVCKGLSPLSAYGKPLRGKYCGRGN